EPGVVYRHTKLIIDRFETFFNVPPNGYPSVKPFRGYPPHPHHNGPHFSPSPTLPSSALQPAVTAFAPAPEAANAYAVSLQGPRSRSAASITHAHLADSAGTDVEGFRQQANQMLIRVPHTYPPTSQSQASSLGNAFRPGSGCQFAVQKPQYRLDRTPVGYLQYSHDQRSAVVSQPTYQASRSGHQSPPQETGFAKPTKRSREYSSTQGQVHGLQPANPTGHHNLSAAANIPVQWGNGTALNTHNDILEKRRRKDGPSEQRTRARTQAAREEAEASAAKELETLTEMITPNDTATPNQTTIPNEPTPSNETTTSKGITTPNETIIPNDTATLKQTTILNEMTIPNETTTSNEPTTSNGMTTPCDTTMPNTLASPNAMSAQNKPVATDAIADGDKSTPGNDQTNEAELVDVKLEDLRDKGISRFVEGKVDDGLWFE
ncbi:MAG: hypothetical protein Q9198_008518, partial [Flavoplaca austrocitrina]